MKNKKIWAMIGVILACVLLVGTLAVPVFADTSIPDVPIDSFAPQQAYNDFRELLRANGQDNHSVLNLLDWYRLNYGSQYVDNGIFRASTLYVSMIDYTSVYYVLPSVFNGGSALSPDDDMFVFTTYFDVISLEWFLDDDGVTNRKIETDGYIECTIYAPASGELNIAYNIYNDNFDLYLYLTGTYSDRSYTIRPSGFYAEGSFEIPYEAFINGGYLDIAYVPTQDISSAVYNELLASLLGCTVISPKTFWYGWTFARSYLNSDAGFESGYKEGFDAGKKVGYEEGAATVSGYDDGYQAAIDDIEDGDFGRNFLSGVFTAPLEAMKSFELVSWTLDDGTEISISLITIISAIVGLTLFIWFLKMFSGG